MPPPPSFICRGASRSFLKFFGLFSSSLPLRCKCADAAPDPHLPPPSVCNLLLMKVLRGAGVSVGFREGGGGWFWLLLDARWKSYPQVSLRKAQKTEMKVLQNRMLVIIPTCWWLQCSASDSREGPRHMPRPLLKV